MKFSLQFIVFLILNFGALGIGSLFMGDAVNGDWYQSLNKAPWSPPGWVFGAAWFTVMLTFSVFMAKITEKKAFWNLRIPVILLFWIQWVLNILWNLLFFKFQLDGLALLEINLLFVIILAIFMVGLKNKGLQGLWVLPYLIWLFVAITLNAYIFFFN